MMNNGKNKEPYFELIKDELTFYDYTPNQFWLDLKDQLARVKHILEISFELQEASGGETDYRFYLEGIEKPVGIASCKEYSNGVEITFYECNIKPDVYPEWFEDKPTHDENGKPIIYGLPAVSKFLHNEVANNYARNKHHAMPYPLAVTDIYGLRRIWPGKPEIETTKEGALTPIIIPKRTAGRDGLDKNNPPEHYVKVYEVIKELGKIDYPTIKKRVKYDGEPIDDRLIKAIVERLKEWGYLKTPDE